MNSESFEYMGFWIRSAAYLIDFPLSFIIPVVIGVGIYSALGYGWGSADPWSKDPSDATIVWVSVFSLVPLYLYYILLIAFNKGQTVGKMLLRIQVVDRNGDPPDLGRAILRETLGRMVSTNLFSLFWLVLTHNKRRWNDYVGGTYVIRKR